MKKFILLLFITPLLFNCGDDDGDVLTCADAQTASQEAKDNYDTNETTGFCNAYVSTLEKQILACGDANGSLQAIIDDLGDCSEDDVVNPNESLVKVTIGTLERTFDENITVNSSGTTLYIRANDGGDYILFDLEKSETGPNVISNFTLNVLSKDFTPAEPSVVGTFTSSITTNNESEIVGSFSGPVESSDNAVLSLTSGSINITY